MPTDNEDLGRDKIGKVVPRANVETGSPGYETTDVNVNGVVVFLSGLLGFVAIFFVFCFIMGRVINKQFLKEDGPPTKWSEISATSPLTKKRENLANNPDLDQQQLQRMTAIFPTPRLDVDDGNQATADLHAREDLLLENYSSIEGEADTVRIPIERAMLLVVERQQSKPSNNEGAEGDLKTVEAPLTTGFARTGYELDTMEARSQKMNYMKTLRR